MKDIAVLRIAPLSSLVPCGIAIHGANGSAPEHNKRALQYISTGQVPVKDLITRHIPLKDVLDAFQIVKSGEAIKVTVEPASND